MDNTKLYRYGYVDGRLEKIFTAQAKLGTIQNWLIRYINDLFKSLVLTQKAVGRIIDVDFASDPN